MESYCGLFVWIFAYCIFHHHRWHLLWQKPIGIIKEIVLLCASVINFTLLGIAKLDIGKNSMFVSSLKKLDFFISLLVLPTTSHIGLSCASAPHTWSQNFQSLIVSSKMCKCTVWQCQTRSHTQPLFSILAYNTTRHNTFKKSKQTQTYHKNRLRKCTRIVSNAELFGYKLFDTFLMKLSDLVIISNILMSWHFYDY